MTLQHNGIIILYQRLSAIKWASSRPDMFGKNFCGFFEQLQDDTTPHQWRYTEEILKASYGENWEEHFQIGRLLGSGCIGQGKNTYFVAFTCFSVVCVSLMIQPFCYCDSI
jgi:hypothetical protein